MGRTIGINFAVQLTQTMHTCVQHSKYESEYEYLQNNNNHTNAAVFSTGGLCKSTEDIIPEGSKTNKGIKSLNSKSTKQSVHTPNTLVSRDSCRDL